jgi:hypothetical protein
MQTFFTADRSMRLASGMTLELFQKPQNMKQALQVRDVFDHADLEALLAKEFPEGISRHGMQYLLDNNNYRHLNGATDFEWVRYSPAVELIFEYVRKADFPELPSRFTCAFACDTPEEAGAFFGNQSLPVFEIKTSLRVFRADENFLKISPHHLGTILMAKRYWSGEMSANPKVEVLLECPAVIGRKVESY